MATLLVYLEASPAGIHPASALGLCVARDLGSARGATVVALAAPRATQDDARVLREATRRGADRVVFCPDGGMERLGPSMQPKCVLGPATPHAREVMSRLSTPQDPTTIAWVQGPAEPPNALDGTVALLAGALPWHDLDTNVIPEYPSAEQIPDLSAVPPGSNADDAPELRFVLDPEHDNAQIRAELSLLGATPLDEGTPAPDRCVRLCVGRALPVTATPTQRWILIPGDPKLSIDTAWGQADWVLPGTAYDAIRSLHSQLWRPHLR